MRFNYILFIGLIVLILLFSGCAENSATDPIVGNWSNSFMSQDALMVFHGDNTITSYSNGVFASSSTWSSNGALKYIVTYNNKTTGEKQSLALTLSSDKKTFSFDTAPMFIFTKQ